jgi:phosphoribosylanthranilate isomerase
VDWEALAREEPFGRPVALAGGLTPANVVRAVNTARAEAVDTASGVEAAPGRKDAALMRAFVAAARTALGLTG